MGKGSIIQELRRSLDIPRTHEDTLIIPMEDITIGAIHIMEEVHTTIVALRLVMGMEEATVRAVPTL